MKFEKTDEELESEFLEEQTQRTALMIKASDQIPQFCFYQLAKVKDNIGLVDCIWLRDGTKVKQQLSTLEKFLPSNGKVTDTFSSLITPICRAHLYLCI